MAILLGLLTKNQKVIFPNTDRSAYAMTKWKFLLESPFSISDQCCTVMKKKPAHNYYKETKRKPILATMAEESRLRKQKWIQNGCNGFEMKIPTSTPMSFWTEQDVLKYIKRFNIPIASVYGDIVYKDDDGMQYDFDLFNESMKLETTGCKRTGCMFCGYGCHLEQSPGRFELMKKTHPKQYEWIMKPWDQGGLGFKEVIDWLNEHGNLNIKY